MTDFARTIVIDSRYSGPPGLGNGGYVAGVVAAALGAEATVTLRAPIPLDTPLELAGNGGRDASANTIARGTRRTELRSGDSLLAEGVAGTPDLPSPPAVPERSTALAASGRYAGRTPNPYEQCFVCGFTRTPGSALRVFAGPTPTPGLVAADWPVHPDLADEDGAVPDEYLWGALDCPGAYAVGIIDLRLGRMTARISGRVRPGERCTVAGWRLGAERRKHFTGTAVYGEAGDVVALAHSIWIAPRADGTSP
ncbi:MAG: hypothetical protein OXC01_20755 [Immundisolibacterales bacterium]|nr:hypothetical protein [Immundisolibacterales bacterium]